MLHELAAGREVIVSRGELIEIGDGFRIPEIMSRSGVLLREVGTTNRTLVEDYANAMNERSALSCAFIPLTSTSAASQRIPISRNSVRWAASAAFPCMKI